MNDNLIKKVFIFLFLINSSTASFAVSKKKITPVIETETKHIESARIISCAIRFPTDSVRFSEKQVTSCMKSANLDSISYIHVIATASSSGSGSHNLYLSTRRAGAIEAYLNNHYPTLQVHAFGGGENPKFGKVARIFIVENNKKPNELSPGVQVASMGPPEVIEKITTKYVTRLEYRDRPKQQIDFNFDSGIANSNFSDDYYSYVGLNIDKTVNLPYLYLRQTELGLRIKVLQSNYASDIHSINGSIAKKWNFKHFLIGNPYLKQSLELGFVSAIGQDFELGTSSTAGISFGDFQLFTVATLSNYLKSIGIGIGGNL